MIESVITRKYLHTLCLVVASGCATIVSKSEYDVAIECSAPISMVNIYKGEELVASTAAPSVVTLSSKGGYFRPALYRFEFVKNGYRDEVDLRAGFDWWYIGNAILPFGCVFALLVDPVTGAMWKFDDNVSVFGCIRPNEQNHIQPSPREISHLPSSYSNVKTNSLPAANRPMELPANTISNAPAQMIEIDAIVL